MIRPRIRICAQKVLTSRPSCSMPDHYDHASAQKASLATIVTHGLSEGEKILPMWSIPSH